MTTSLQAPFRRVALITGVGRQRGIGAGVARALASRGWDLALNHWAAYDRRMPWGSAVDETAEIAAELRTHGVRIVSIEADLESASSASQIFQVASSDLGSLTALVLCHCESVASGILETSLESFDRHFAVNARASWQLIREFALQIPPSGGKIIGLTSDSTVGNLPYGCSKGALDRIVLAAARELSHLGITANVINPGPVDTGWMDAAVRSEVLQRQPGKSLGTPERVADVIAFLLSPAGAWINGQLIKADGGFSA
jgi:3-oxoacyl-[acyl-carrier protein] reductase